MNQIEGRYTDSHYHEYLIDMKKKQNTIYLVVEHPENESNIIEFEFDMSTFSSRLNFDNDLHSADLSTVNNVESLSMNWFLYLHSFGSFSLNLDVSKENEKLFYLKISRNGNQIFLFDLKEISKHELQFYNEHQVYEFHAGNHGLPLFRLSRSQNKNFKYQKEELHFPVIDWKITMITQDFIKVNSLFVFAETNQKKYFDLRYKMSESNSSGYGNKLKNMEITAIGLDCEYYTNFTHIIKIYLDYRDVGNGFEDVEWFDGEIESTIGGEYFKPLKIQVDQTKISVNSLIMFQGLDERISIVIDEYLGKADFFWFSGPREIIRISSRKQVLFRNKEVDVRKVRYFTSEDIGITGTLTMLIAPNRVKVVFQEIETDLKVSMEGKREHNSVYQIDNIDGFGTIFEGSPLFKWNSSYTVQNNGSHFRLEGGGKQSFNKTVKYENHRDQNCHIELSESFMIDLDLKSPQQLVLQTSLSSNIFPDATLNLNTASLPYYLTVKAPLPDQRYLDIIIVPDMSFNNFNIRIMSGNYSPDSFEVSFTQTHFVLNCDHKLKNCDFTFNIPMPDNNQIQMLSNPAEGNILSIKSNNVFGFKSLEIVTEGEWKNLVLNGLHIATYQYRLFEKHVSIEMYGVVANLTWEFAPYYNQGKLNTINVELTASGVSVSSNLTLDLRRMILEIEETINIPQLPAISPIKAKIKGGTREKSSMFYLSLGDSEFLLGAVSEVSCDGNSGPDNLDDDGIPDDKDDNSDGISDDLDIYGDAITAESDDGDRIPINLNDSSSVPDVLNDDGYGTPDDLDDDDDDGIPDDFDDNSDGISDDLDDDGIPEDLNNNY